MFVVGVIGDRVGPGGVVVDKGVVVCCSCCGFDALSTLRLVRQQLNRGVLGGGKGLTFRSPSRQLGIGRGFAVLYLFFAIGFPVAVSTRLPSGANREVSSTPNTV
jgi:hypothetical protein